MRLPFLQVEADLLGIQSKVAAGMLRATPACVVGYVAFMRAYVLSLSDDGEVTGLVRGPSAARGLALAAGWEGDPEAFVAALADPSVRLLEVRPDGIFVRGMEPYEKARKKSAAGKERMRKSREARRLRATSENDGAKKKSEKKTQTEIFSPSEGTTVASAPVAPAPPGKTPIARAAATNALGEFIDWAREEAKPRLPGDAVDVGSGMTQVERAKLGEAVKAHGLETMKTAFRLWLGWTAAQEKGYPLGFFAHTLTNSVAQAKAKPADATAAPKPAMRVM